MRITGNAWQSRASVGVVSPVPWHDLTAMRYSNDRVARVHQGALRMKIVALRRLTGGRDGFSRQRGLVITVALD